MSDGLVWYGGSTCLRSDSGRPSPCSRDVLHSADCKRGCVSPPPSSPISLFLSLSLLPSVRHTHLTTNRGERERDNDWRLIYTVCVRAPARVCEGERVRTSAHCYCLQHFSLVWFHLGREGMLFLFGCILCRGVRRYKISNIMCFFFLPSFYAVIDVASLFFFVVFLWTDQTSCPCCGDSVWSALDDECLWFPFMLFFKHRSRMSDTKQYFSVIYSKIIIGEKKERKKSPLWHVARPSTPPLPRPPPLSHEVHWQCTTHNEGSLHASMKLNLRCEWMTEKSCRLWFILMKLYFKTALATELSRNTISDHSGFIFWGKWKCQVCTGEIMISTN